MDTKYICGTIELNYVLVHNFIDITLGPIGDTFEGPLWSLHEKQKEEKKKKKKKKKNLFKIYKFFILYF